MKKILIILLSIGPICAYSQRLSYPYLNASDSSGLSASENTISAILQVQVYLESTTGATKSAFGKSFDIHYEVEKIGSQGEITD